MSLEMAQSVNLRSVRPRPELGVKPTSRLNARTSQFDPITDISKKPAEVGSQRTESAANPASAMYGLRVKL
jgi:hypothetical protein